MAKFCSECGTALDGAKFCPECGHPAAGEPAQAVASPAEPGPRADGMADTETFKYGFMKTPLEVGPDGIKDGDHFIPYSQLRSVDKSGGKWSGFDLDLVWGKQDLGASNHSSGHRFGFGDRVESRDRAYDLIVSRMGEAARRSSA